MDDELCGECPLPREVPLAMSYEEYRAIPTPTQAEWVDGVCVVFRPQRRDEASLKLQFAHLVASFVERHDLGEVIIAPFEMRLRGGRSAREPDILFLAKANGDRLTEDRLEGPADLVVEIVSEDSADRDCGEKVREYAAAGVPEYILLDPRPGRHRIAFYRRSEAGTYETVAPDADGRYDSVALRGFWFRAEWLWQTPSPRVSALLREIEGQPVPPPPPAHPSSDPNGNDGGLNRSAQQLVELA